MTCNEDDCTRPIYIKHKMLCQRHYNRWWRNQYVCSVEQCGRPHAARSLCTKHHRQFLSEGIIPRTVAEPRVCSVDGCDSEPYSKSAKYCQAHRRYRKHVERLPCPYPGWDWNLGPDPDGYVNIARSLPNGKMLRRKEHRIVMEIMIGRELLKHENVHHKNGDRGDNRPDNLELWSTSQPNGQRVEDKVAWAKELLALYEPSALTQKESQ